VKTPGSGRKKGTPNKVTGTVRERLAALGCDPIDGLAAIASDTKVDVAVRRQAYSDLAKYSYPQLKALEISGPADRHLCH